MVRASSPPRGDDGFGLTELLVAMFLFAGVSTATVALLITSLQTLQESNQRVQTANVARTQVQALRATDVESIPLGMSSFSPVTAGVPDGTVVSTTSEWVGLGQAASSCREAAPGQAYLRVHVQVRSPDTQTESTVDTVITPPDSPSDPGTGAMTIEVIDQNGEPVGGVQVASSDPTHPENRFVLTTGDDGCLFVPGLTAPAMLELTAGRSGYVASTPTGSQDAVQLDPDSLSRSMFHLAAASSIIFDSELPDFPIPNSLQVTWQLNETGAVIDSAELGTMIGELWPTTTGFTAWLGSCSDSDPQFHGRQRQSFDLRAGATTRAALAAQPVEFLGLLPGVSVSVRHVGAPCPTGGIAMGAANANGILRGALPFGSWVFTATDGTYSEDSQPTLLVPPTPGQPMSVASVEFETWVRLASCPLDSDHPDKRFDHVYDPLVDAAECYDALVQP